MSLRIFLFITLVSSLGLLYYSISLSRYTDAKKVDLLHHSPPFTREAYYQVEDAFRTNKVPLMDLGGGLLVASATILVFFVGTKIKKISDFRKLETIREGAVFWWANGIWLLLLPGAIWNYTFRLGRGDYAPFSDSIAIPITAQFVACLLLLVPLNLFLLLTIQNANLPAKLFVRASSYTWKPVLWEVLFGFLLLLNLLLFGGFVLDGDHVSVFVNLFFTYLLLSLRAGQISRFIQTETELLQPTL